MPLFSMTPTSEPTNQPPHPQGPKRNPASMGFLAVAVPTLKYTKNTLKSYQTEVYKPAD